MIKAIIFDLDDTLIKEEDFIKSGFKHISRKISKYYSFNFFNVYKELVKLFFLSPLNVFDRFFDLKGVDVGKDFINLLIHEYRNHIPNIVLPRKVEKTLAKLRSQGYKLGIITDGYKETQQNKIKALNLDLYIDKIIVTDELGREYWKPHILPFEKIKKSLEVEFFEMIYIGDNPKKDFYIGSIYPIKTVRIYNKGIYGSDDYYKGIKENFAITKLEQIEKIIERIKGVNCKE